MYSRLYPVYTMKLARRASSTSAHRAIDELARRALDERSSSTHQAHIKLIKSGLRLVDMA